MSAAQARGSGHPPDAIVLCTALTGLATVRALGEEGVRVLAIVFDPDDPVIRSRYASIVVRAAEHGDKIAVVRLVQQLARQLGTRPVVLPTSDAHALALAEHLEELQADCRISTTSHGELSRIVAKNTLYRVAQHAGVAVVPFVSDASVPQITNWSAVHPAPYLLKPIYHSASTSLNGEKNLVLPTRQDLLDYVQTRGTSDLVVQRLLTGGDGEIYDSYGLCNAQGKAVVMASHRRIRQSRPDFGTTCYGRIPSGLGVEADQTLFALTERLLGASHFHGIFGIEWLRDVQTGKFYVIDFNARSFLSIGHLNDCGLNLPHLAYLELMGRLAPDMNARPELVSRVWMDMLRDLRTLHVRRGPSAVRPMQWCLQALSASSSAYWSWRDPMPGLVRAWEIVALVLSFAWRRLSRRNRVERAKGIEPSS